MTDVSTLIWQTEIFFSMSTKVADPALAATLRKAAENYLTQATEAAHQEQVDRSKVIPSPSLAV